MVTIEETMQSHKSDDSEVIFALNKLVDKKNVLHLYGSGQSYEMSKYIEALPEFFTKYSHVTSLHIRNTILSESKYLLGIISKLEISSLVLMNCQLTDANIELISRSPVHQLRLPNNKLTDKSADYFVSMSHLKKLSLLNNKFSIKGVKTIIKNKSINHLVLMGNRCQKDDLKKLLVTRPSLTIDILNKSSDIENETKVVVKSDEAEILEQQKIIQEMMIQYERNNVIKELTDKQCYQDLVKNLETKDEKNMILTLQPNNLDLRPKHFEMLPQFLRDYPAVKTLKIKNFSFNSHIKENNDDSLLKTIASLNLITLSMSNCNLGSQEAKILANSKVTNLLLPSNHITNEGAECILTSMSLNELNLSNNDIDQNALTKFVEASKNKSNNINQMMEVKLSKQSITTDISKLNSSIKSVSQLSTVEEKVDVNKMSKEIVYKIEKYMLSQSWSFNYFWNGKEFTDVNKKSVRVPRRVYDQLQLIQDAKKVEHSKFNKLSDHWIKVLSIIIVMNQKAFKETKSSDKLRAVTYGLFQSDKKEQFCKSIGIEKNDLELIIKQGGMTELKNR